MTVECSLKSRLRLDFNDTARDRERLNNLLRNEPSAGTSPSILFKVVADAGASHFVPGCL